MQVFISPSVITTERKKRGDLMKSVILFLVFLLSAPSVFGNSVTGKGSERIVGGGDAVEGQVPFIVSLRKYNQHFCGGTLVNETWVVTAAHCIDGVGKPDDVLVGSITSKGSKGSKMYKVESVFVHPNYNKNIQSGSDFALVKLIGKTTVEFAELNIKDPSSLAVKDFTVAGWGALEEGAYGTPSVLQTLDVPYVDQQLCEKQFQDLDKSSTPYLDNSMFCAGYPEGGKDACQGDSGGPIFYKDITTNKFILTGVVSWGYGCARKDLSGVYSNVATESNWFNDTIKNN